MSERYVLIALSLGSNILLARLLTPEEIGIYSVGLALIGIAQVLRDFGVGNFLIQEKDLTEAHIRTAFGISLAIGGALFFIVYFAAPWAAQFYNEARLLQTLQISALNFLTLPFCTISLALLRREMAFNRLVSVTLTAASLTSAATVGLAYAGFGPNSMAVGAVVGNVVTGIGAWLATTDRKLRWPAFSEWRVVLKFGAQSSVASVVTSVAMDINDLVLAKILGFAPVAMMSRAQGLMNLFHRDIMSAIRNVAYPSFAKAHREDHNLEERYIASVTAVTVFAWPFYGFAALFSLEIIRLMFGPQWDAAARLVPIFCLAGAFAATSNLILNAVMAVGRNDLVMSAELLFQPLRAALIIVAAVVFQSLLACALAYLIAFSLHTPFLYAIKARCIPNDSKKLLLHLWHSAKVALAALLLPAMMLIPFGFDREQPLAFWLLLSAVLMCLSSWIAAVAFFKHPITADPMYQSIKQKVPFLG